MKSSCTRKKTPSNVEDQISGNSLRSASDRFNMIFIDNDFVKEQVFVFSFSSSFRSPRSVTRRRFWTLTTLLKVGDILNIPLSK